MKIARNEGKLIVIAVSPSQAVLPAAGFHLIESCSSNQTPAFVVDERMDGVSRADCNSGRISLDDVNMAPFSSIPDPLVEPMFDVGTHQA